MIINSVRRAISHMFQLQMLQRSNLHSDNCCTVLIIFKLYLYRVTVAFKKNQYQNYSVHMCLLCTIQNTLIVWTESETCDLALSFQERSGCDEVWTKICEVSTLFLECRSNSNLEHHFNLYGMTIKDYYKFPQV